MSRASGSRCWLPWCSRAAATRPASARRRSPLSVGGRSPGRRFAAQIDQARRSYEAAGRPFPATGTPAYERLKAITVRLLVERAELDVEADRLGIAITPAQIDARLSRFKQSAFRGNERLYRQRLREQRTTDAEVRAGIRDQLLAAALRAAGAGGAEAAECALCEGVRTLGRRLSARCYPAPAHETPLARSSRASPCIARVRLWRRRWRLGQSRLRRRGRRRRRAHHARPTRHARPPGEVQLRPSEAHVPEGGIGRVPGDPVPDPGEPRPARPSWSRRRRASA